MRTDKIFNVAYPFWIRDMGAGEICVISKPCQSTTANQAKIGIVVQVVTAIFYGAKLFIGIDFVILPVIFSPVVVVLVKFLERTETVVKVIPVWRQLSRWGCVPVSLGVYICITVFFIQAGNEIFPHQHIQSGR